MVDQRGHERRFDPGRWNAHRLAATLAAHVTRPIEAVARWPRRVRRWLAAAMDICLCIVAVWISWSLRLGEWQLFGRGQIVLAAAALAFWIPIVVMRRTYATLIRYSGGRTMAGLAVTCGILAIPMTALFMVKGIVGVPRTMGLLHPIIFLVLLCISRMVVRFVLTEALQIVKLTKPRRNVCIYGAGDAGKQLALTLRHELQVRVVAFVDDDDHLAGQLVDSVMVHPSQDLGRLIESGTIDEVFLAMPSISRARHRQIVSELSQFSIHVRTLPSFSKLIDGEVTLSDLREVGVDELLGRDPVPPLADLLDKTVTGRVVMVTGAGGSIGSELVRQLAVLRPSRLILVEMSEFALYSVDQEIRLLCSDLDLVPELASIADRKVIDRIIAKYRPEILFHAAAYKHVPLVEANPLAGVRNNVVGTWNLALAARNHGVAKFILVSTDKAVRPTNVMGATKRICEMILQAMDAEGGTTCFSMVRFGNVLGSSGSVVPLFKRQIGEGGPVTVTHHEVTRFFMTIPEAASLVIQAAAMAKGGEVFVLDMGQSVRIIDLARTMIRLSGLTVRDKDNPEGDIEILEIGLRPGEKLYEELLIGDSAEPTLHPRIMQAQEQMLPWSDLAPALVALEENVISGDAGHAITLIRQLVPHLGENAGPAMPVRRIAALASP